MRIGLLASINRDAHGRVLAAKVVGGRSLFDWQIDLARRAGCEAIVCLSEDRGAIHRDIERSLSGSGIEFHILPNHLEICRLISSEDEILLIGDGAIVDFAVVEKVLINQRGVLALPAAHWVPKGFERIDAHYAFGGVALVPGKLAKGLAQLPADGAADSFLMRLALQSGVPILPIDGNELDQSHFLMAIEDEAVAQFETALLAPPKSARSLHAPLLALTAWVAQRMARKGLRRAIWITIFVALALALGGVAIQAAQGSPWMLASLAVSRLATDLGEHVDSIRQRIGAISISDHWWFYINGLFDVVVVASIAWSASPGSIIGGALMGAAMIAAFRCAQELASGKLAQLWSDRALALVILALADGFGVLLAAVGALAFFALLSVLVPIYRNRLTRA